MLRALTVFGLTLFSAASAVQASDALPTTQLPRDVRPTHYEISIVPDPASLTFTGTVAINVEVVKPTSSIKLQAADLTFRSARLSQASPGSVPASTPRIAVDAEAQTATFSFDRKLGAGRYRLDLEYSGKIGTQAFGLFALDYETKQGKKRALFSQFENSDARRMIPSWDEPAYKATFALHATIPAGQMAVSNMPASAVTDAGEGKIRVDFAPSPRMSTYLLFFAMGDFERISTTADGVEIGVVTRKGASDQGRFALESSKDVLREYNRYFDIPYPLPKLDNVAAPGSSQFFGAMENWGAIFTFEYYLLLDPGISTQSDRQEAFRTAAHEISHQWFGNLVTMKWWDDLWLNEGFASWMEGRTTEWLHPEWNTALEAVGNRESAMRRDSVSTTHPVIQRIETVEQASQAFDTITYQKGEAVIRMLESYVGADRWRDGVRRYLKAHLYGNTASDDLWKAMEAAAAEPIRDIAHDFTLQPGVPLVTVNETSCEQGRTRVSLRQGEFSEGEGGRERRWRTPVALKNVGASTPMQTLIRNGRLETKIPGCAATVVNAGQNGYFRTLYAPKPFRNLVSSFAKVDPIDQLGVLLDTWALGLAGLQPASDFMDLTRATPDDADPQVWGQISGVFQSINGYLRGRGEAQKRFRDFAISRLRPVFERSGWTERADEPPPVTVLRETLLAALGDLGDPEIIEEARRRYRALATDPSAVPGPLRRVVLGIVARHADAEIWNAVRREAQSETNPLVKDQLYLLLAITEDPNLARRALELALTDEPGATNGSAMISAVAALHPDLAFDFAIARIDQVDARVDASSRTRYYATLADGSADRAMIAKLEKYAKERLADGSRRDAETAIASIQSRLRIVEDRLPEIDRWLLARR